MEEMLELRPNPDQPPGSADQHFISANPIWHAAQARGIYGGILISQSLVAAQKCVPPSHIVRSMRCSFLQGGDPTRPISYRVQKLSGGDKAIVTVAVEARQGTNLVFAATGQFPLQDPSNDTAATKGKPSPPPPEMEDEDDGFAMPFYNREKIVSDTNDPRNKTLKKLVWLRSQHQLRGNTTQTHLAALAFLSDSFFITTVAQTMGLQMRHRTTRASERPTSKAGEPPPSTVGMMVSLDHTIYFHNYDFRGDEWIFTEMEVLWAGQGRALVQERMYSPSGSLLATCVQEGVIRLLPESEVARM